MTMQGGNQTQSVSDEPQPVEEDEEATEEDVFNE
jgi:hypothetical protein